VDEVFGTHNHKTDMGEGQPVLRSKDPEGVAQEMWALFAVYQAICQLIGAGVDAAGIPPGRISFPRALAAAASTITAAFPPFRDAGAHLDHDLVARCGHDQADIDARCIDQPWYDEQIEPTFEDMLVKVRLVIMAARSSLCRRRPTADDEIRAVTSAWTTAEA
jgi:hypothetical protein